VFVAPQYIYTVITFNIWSRFTKELSTILQKPSLDVVVAEAEINLVKQTLEGIGQFADDVFHEDFECITHKAINHR